MILFIFQKLFSSPNLSFDQNRTSVCVWKNLVSRALVTRSCTKATPASECLVRFQSFQRQIYSWIQIEILLIHIDFRLRFSEFSHSNIDLNCVQRIFSSARPTTSDLSIWSRIRSIVVLAVQYFFNFNFQKILKK